ncbi:hypothetical protein E2C01_053553 [Portunus trituberculatus]|uniref:Uncharacterized protein n=1 Tax=Portunus trituberculatus TaxID=210409 RepID=A0A5B7GH31_PORTR|nr:hypothetical protein [Portunus trituberculatus]
MLYLEFLRDNMIENGFHESLFFTSDTPTGTQDLGAIPGVPFRPSIAVILATHGLQGQGVEARPRQRERVRGRSVGDKTSTRTIKGFFLLYVLGCYRYRFSLSFALSPTFH